MHVTLSLVAVTGLVRLVNETTRDSHSSRACLALMPEARKETLWKHASQFRVYQQCVCSWDHLTS